MSEQERKDQANRENVMAEHAGSPVTILMAEDNIGHATLIQKALRDAGLVNPIRHFKDGREILDYLEAADTEQAIQAGKSFLLLLDIQMPRVDGVEVLRALKGNPALKTIPAIMLTTTDDPREIQRCYELGCNFYITKPVAFPHFIDTLNRVGLFIQVVQVAPLPSGGG
jgi:CheY-like chemotaxis protein